jgi:hypothetical protein
LYCTSSGPSPFHLSHTRLNLFAGLYLGITVAHQNFDLTFPTEIINNFVDDYD